jgi:hypothetical protein
MVPARSLLVSLAAAAALALVPSAAHAQIARTFELRARPGYEAQLDDGYRRHLDWHVAAGDRWVWYLWQVTNGERAGLYVDGTFGRAWKDFDAAVDPRGDAADNDRNVDPFATREANETWRLRPDLGAGVVDLERGALVLRTEYRVRPGAAAAFARALVRLRAERGERPFAVFERVTGGAGATYVVWVPAGSWAELGAFADAAAGARSALADAAEPVRDELWRFRPDLSVCLRTESRCHATLGASASR